MKKLILLSLIAISLGLTDFAWAKDKKNRKTRKKKAGKNKVVNKLKPVPGMFTVTGIVSKTVLNEKEVYVLTSRAGNIVYLPAPKEPKKELAEDAPEEINITDYLEQRVTIFGKGFSKTTQKSPNPIVTIKAIISIRKIDEAEEEQEAKKTIE